MRIAQFALIFLVSLVPFLARAEEQPARPQSVHEDAVQPCDVTERQTESEHAECSGSAATDHDLTPSYVEIAIEHVGDAAVPDHLAYGSEQEDYAE